MDLCPHRSFLSPVRILHFKKKQYTQAIVIKGQTKCNKDSKGFPFFLTFPQKKRRSLNYSFRTMLTKQAPQWTQFNQQHNTPIYAAIPYHNRKQPPFLLLASTHTREQNRLSINANAFFSIVWKDFRQRTQNFGSKSIIIHSKRQFNPLWLLWLLPRA